MVPFVRMRRPCLGLPAVPFRTTSMAKGTVKGLEEPGDGFV